MSIPVSFLAPLAGFAALGAVFLMVPAPAEPSAAEAVEVAIAHFKTGDRGYLEELQAVLGREPDNVRANMAMGVIETEKRNYAEAKPYLERVLAKEPDNVEALLSMAVLLQKSRKNEEAVSAYKALIAKVPNDPRPLYNLGNLEIDLRRYRDARDHLRAYRDVAPPRMRESRALKRKLAALDDELGDAPKPAPSPMPSKKPLR